MFSSGLEIFSTLNIHYSVYGCPFYVRFNLTKSTIVNRALAGPVRPADKADIAKKNYLKPRPPFYIGEDYKVWNR